MFNVRCWTFIFLYKTSNLEWKKTKGKRLEKKDEHRILNEKKVRGLKFLRLCVSHFETGLGDSFGFLDKI